MNIFASGSMLCGAALVLSLVVSGCSSTTKSAPAEAAPPTLVGGDRDAHGCIGSAGYQWCAKENTCVQPWVLAKEKGFELTAEAIGAYCGIDK